MVIEQQLILPCRLCERSEDKKGQEVLALKVVKSRSRHLKENRSVERRNLIVPIVVRRAGQRSLGKSTENMTVPEDDHNRSKKKREECWKGCCCQTKM